jgi:hypothetical protein
MIVITLAWMRWRKNMTRVSPVCFGQYDHMAESIPFYPGGGRGSWKGLIPAGLLAAYGLYRYATTPRIKIVDYDVPTDLPPLIKMKSVNIISSYYTRRQSFRTQLYDS